MTRSSPSLPPSSSSPTPSSASSPLPPPPPQPSKLARLLTRDRSRSLLDSPSTYSSSSSSVPPSPADTHPTPRRSLIRPGSSFRKGPPSSSSHSSSSATTMGAGASSSSTTTTMGAPAGGLGDADVSFDDETPVIVEPSSASGPAPASPRTRSARPHSSTDLPGRLSGWFSHAFTSSSHTDLSLPSLLASASATIATTPSRAITASSSSSSTANANSNNNANTTANASSSALTSPRSKAGALLRTGRGHLDRAMRYILDADATPDRCRDDIWVLGVRHPGWREGDEEGGDEDGEAGGEGRRRASVDEGRQLRDGDEREVGMLSRSQPPSSGLNRKSREKDKDRDNTKDKERDNIKEKDSTKDKDKDKDKDKERDPAWPSAFLADFSSVLWLTYRSHFPPIRDSSLGALDAAYGPPDAFAVSTAPGAPGTGGRGMLIPGGAGSGSASNSGAGAGGGNGGAGAGALSSSPRRWNWLPEKGWTTDAGWGCMLRTGQSLLATALVRYHLGRDFRRPRHAAFAPSYATYVRVLTWFIDSPSPLAPFSVHRMALAGKDLGKDVGQWFGPSTAAGALRTLTEAYPAAGIGVALAVDSQIFESDVYAASHAPDRGARSGATSPPSSSSASSPSLASPRSSNAHAHPHGHRTVHGQSPYAHRRARAKAWGERGVLVLIGIRLGLEGVNPIYYETVKTLFTFPQSVGIAGGRPSSSYFFVGTQADALFYLDPHHTRPAVPLRPTPPVPESADERTSRHTRAPTSPASYAYSTTRAPPGARSRISPAPSTRSHASPPPSVRMQASPPPSARSSSLPVRSPPQSTRSPPPSTRSPPPPSPSPLAQQLSTSSSTSSGSGSGIASGGSSVGHARWHTTTAAAAALDDEYVLAGGARGGVGPTGLTPLEEHLVTAYAPQELRTFHCERVRKLPLSGLDPSMLIGFLCRDEDDWRDLRRRITDLGKEHKAIFSVQDEPPAWSSDSDSYMGLESLSEPDPDPDALDADADPTAPGSDDDDDDDGDGSSNSSSDDFFDASEGRPRDGGSDGAGPVTPGPSGSSFSFAEVDVDASNGGSKIGGVSADGGVGEDDDDDGEWIEPPPMPTKRKKATAPRVPFPIADGEEPARVPLMSNQRARDGGRTQSGGVKGVLADE